MPEASVNCNVSGRSIPKKEKEEIKNKNIRNVCTFIDLHTIKAILDKTAYPR